MAIPKSERLTLPVLRGCAKGETLIDSLIKPLAGKFRLTKAEREQRSLYGRHNVIFKNRVEWSVAYLVEAGLLTRTRRSHVTITPLGLETLASRPKIIDHGFLMKFPSFAARSSKHMLAKQKSKNPPPSSSARKIDEADHVAMLRQALSVGHPTLDAALIKLRDAINTILISRAP